MVAIAGYLLFRPDKLFVDDPVDESLEGAFRTTAALVPPTTATPEASIGSTAPVTGPVALAAGRFEGLQHQAAGTATLYEQAGDFLLRFEDDTDIQNGPDLYVWLLAADTYEGGAPAVYLDLGKLKGNLGGQNYQLPQEFDPEVHRTVLIWCLRFRVPFAAASLE